MSIIIHPLAEMHQEVYHSEAPFSTFFTYKLMCGNKA
jgi:hypothetical protein